MPLDRAWKPVACKPGCKDHEFWTVTMGMAAETCPTCGAHLSLKHRICLNACHLTADSQRQFAETMKAVQ